LVWLLPLLKLGLLFHCTTVEATASQWQSRSGTTVRLPKNQRQRPLEPNRRSRLHKRSKATSLESPSSSGSLGVFRLPVPQWAQSGLRLLVRLECGRSLRIAHSLCLVSAATSRLLPPRITVLLARPSDGRRLELPRRAHWHSAACEHRPHCCTLALLGDVKLQMRQQNRTVHPARGMRSHDISCRQNSSGLIRFRSERLLVSLKCSSTPAVTPAT
jgi:hypothetical protein